MAKMIRSARGEQVDFDLVLIKQQITASAAPTNVSNRETFIESKLRRRARRVGKVGAATPSERELGEEVTQLNLEEPDEFKEPEFEEVEVEAEVEPEETTRRVRK